MWDRFDDAMDDMADDIREWNAEIDRLLKECTARGITPPPRPTEPTGPYPTDDAGDYMNAAYGGQTGYWNEVSDYLDTLRDLLQDGEAPADPR